MSRRCRNNSNEARNRLGIARNRQTADGVALADVELHALAIVARAEQQDHAGLAQLVAPLHLGQRARQDQRLAGPVGALDDAQTVGVAVGDEDAEGEGGAHRAFPSSVQVARNIGCLQITDDKGLDVIHQSRPRQSALVDDCVDSRS